MLAHREGRWKGKWSIESSAALQSSHALTPLGYSLVEPTKPGRGLSFFDTHAPFALIWLAHNQSFLDSLGWAYFKLGKLDEAQRYLTEAAGITKTSATIHEHLGDLLERRGKLNEARVEWGKSLSLAVEPAQTVRLKTKLNAATKK